jgi:hypothetical protein
LGIDFTFEEALNYSNEFISLLTPNDYSKKMKIFVKE